MDAVDRDAVIRTVLGEARNQSPIGQAAVAHVIQNRVKNGQWGDNAMDVVMAPHQFEPWQTKAKALWAIPTSDPAYQRAGRIVDAVASGAPDPTGGATHFLNAGTVKGRGTYDTANGLPPWASGPAKTTIGDHAFYAPDGAVSGSNALAYAPPSNIRTPAMDAINNSTDGGGQPNIQQIIAQALARQQGGAQPQQPQFRGFLGRALMGLFNPQQQAGGNVPNNVPALPQAAQHVMDATMSDASQGPSGAPMQLPGGSPPAVANPAGLPTGDAAPMPPPRPADLTPPLGVAQLPQQTDPMAGATGNSTLASLQAALAQPQGAPGGSDPNGGVFTPQSGGMDFSKMLSSLFGGASA